MGEKSSSSSSSAASSSRAHRNSNRRNSGSGSVNGGGGGHDDDKEEEEGEKHFQVISMRLVHPDDETGSWLFTMVPAVVVHRIDPWSPLFPGFCSSTKYEKFVRPDLKSRFNDPESSRFIQRSAMNAYRWPGLLLRQADADGGARDATICTACGETFPSHKALRAHVQYYSYDDAQRECELAVLLFLLPQPCSLSHATYARNSRSHGRRGHARGRAAA